MSRPGSYYVRSSEFACNTRSPGVEPPNPAPTSLVFPQFCEIEPERILGTYYGFGVITDMLAISRAHKFDRHLPPCIRRTFLCNTPAFVTPLW